MTTAESPPKKVLMICYKFPPYMGVGSLRSRKYAQYLEGFGWGCRVLTSCFGQDRKVTLPASVQVTSVYALDISEWLGRAAGWVQSLRRRVKKQRTSGGGLPHASAGSLSEGLGVATRIQQMLLLPDAQFLWILTALPFALWKQRHCQVIYSSAWPLSCHVLGLLVHNLTGKPWVADYRDEWTLNTQWFPPTRFHRWLGEKLDAACVRNARFVVNTTEIRTRNFMEKFGGTLDKYVTIHNGFDEQDVAPYRGLAPPGEILTITSIGSLYGGRDPRLLLSVLSELVQKGTIHKERICLKLIGGENEVLQHEVQQLGIASCVEIIPRLPQPQAFEHLAKSHIALLIGSDMERYAMTTKLYEYAGMGRKIMALVPEGPVWDFVTQSGGVCAMFNDRGQIEQALIQIFEEFKAGRLNVNVQPIQAYERKNLTAQQTELFNRCLFSKEKE